MKTSAASASSLTELTDGNYFPKTDLAIALSELIRKADKYIDLMLALSIVSEVDHWLQTDSGKIIKEVTTKSGKIIRDVRWIYKTFLDCWKDWFPASTEYRVRKAMEVLRELDILLFCQPERHKAYFNHKSYWTLNYQKLQTLVNSRSHRCEDCPHNVVRTVHIDTTTTVQASATQKETPLPPHEKREHKGREESQQTSSCGQKNKNQKGSKKVRDICEDKNSAAATPKPESERVRFKVVDARLGFGDGSNSRLNGQRQQARSYIAEKIIPSDVGREFQKQFGQWEIMQGVEPRYSRVSAVLRQVEAGEYVIEWDEFEQEMPLGTLYKKDWEHLRGLVHPILIQYHARQLQERGESFSQALTKAQWLFKNPSTAQQAWEEWGRRIVSAQAENERLAKLGVKGLTMPVELQPMEKPTPMKVAIALSTLIGQNALTIAQTQPLAAIESEAEETKAIRPEEETAMPEEISPVNTLSDDAPIENLTEGIPAIPVASTPPEEFKNACKELVTKFSLAKSEPVESSSEDKLAQLNADLTDPVLRNDFGIQRLAGRLRGELNLEADYDGDGLICQLQPPVMPALSDFDRLSNLLSSDACFDLETQEEAMEFVAANSDRYLATVNDNGQVTQILEPDF